jgi:hypothetical protein
VNEEAEEEEASEWREILDKERRGRRNIIRPDQRQGEGRRKRVTNGEAGEEEASKWKESLVGYRKGKMEGQRESSQSWAREKHRQT